MASVGTRVRKEREEQGLSRESVAKAAGIAKTTLSDLELGRSQSSAALHRIATALRVRPEWLETGKGSKRPEATQSQSARLTGQMIVNAYRAAELSIKFMADNAKVFDPVNDLADANILARAILHEMSLPGGEEHAQPESGNELGTRSYRGDGEVGGAEGAAESRGESRATPRKQRKHAA